MKDLKEISLKVADWLWTRSGLKSRLKEEPYGAYGWSECRSPIIRLNMKHIFKWVEFSQIVERIVCGMYSEGDDTTDIQDKFLSRIPALVDETGNTIYNSMMGLLAAINDVTKIKRVVIPKESRRFYDLKQQILIDVIKKDRLIKDCWMEVDHEDRNYYVLVVKDANGEPTWTFHQPERNLVYMKRNLRRFLARHDGIRNYHRDNQTEVNIYDREDFTLKEYIDLVDTLYIMYHFWINQQ